MRFPRRFPVVLLVASCCAAQSSTTIDVRQPNGPILLRSGSGSGEFIVHNGTGKELPLNLRTGVVEDAGAHTSLDKAKVGLTVEATGAALPRTIGANTDLPVIATLSGIDGASVAKLHFFNGADDAGYLETTAADAPMNITLTGEGAVAATPLIFEGARPALLTLKNGDAESYPIAWSFRVGRMEQNGSATLPANGTATILLRPTSAIYSLTDDIRPSSQTGRLEVLLGTGDGDNSTAPRRDLSVNLTLQALSSNATTLLSDGYVIVCLLLGGIISLLASAVLPNSLRKSAFRRQLRDLANCTSGVSLRVDSNLRVLLRLERNTIHEALKSTWAIFPSAGASLDDIATDIDQLTKRLAVAERIDDLRQKLEAAYSCSPPSIVDEADASLQAAANSMHSYALSNADIDTATKSLDAAAASLATLADSDQMAKIVAQKFSELRTRMANFLPYYDDLKKALPGVLGVVREPFDNPKNISPRMVYAIDYCVAATHTALDFAVVRQKVPKETRPGDPAREGAPGANPAHVEYEVPQPANEVIEEAKHHQPELERLLGAMEWHSLREARLLVQEMREGTYADDILQEMAAKRAWVKFETQTARPFLPINFYVDFLKWGRESRAAMERLAFRWAFPGGLEEDGTRVCHYFLKDVPGIHDPEGKKFPRKLRVKVTVQKKDGRNGPVMAHVAAAAPGGANAETLEGDIQLDPAASNVDRSRILAELLRFLIAFGVALAGLLSGGVEQLGKLGLIPATFAIVGLGFGADAVKNVLTQPSKAPAPEPAKPAAKKNPA